MESNGLCHLAILRTKRERIAKGIYTPEFRAKAVKRAESAGLTVARAAQQRSMPKSRLEKWVRAAREGQLAEVNQGQRPPNELALDWRAHGKIWPK